MSSPAATASTAFPREIVPPAIPTIRPGPVARWCAARGFLLGWCSPSAPAPIHNHEDPMASTQNPPRVRIAPNNPVFDLPVIVGIEEGLFAKAGLDVSFSATYADREKDRVEKSVFQRVKEEMFECGAADSYNVCEWASIDRLERGKRGGKVAALRAAVAAQAVVTFDERLQTPRDMADVPVVVQELTGSHYTTLQMLESAVGREH